jgi:hypothetical protein
LHDLFGYTNKHAAKDKNAFTRQRFPFVLKHNKKSFFWFDSSFSVLCTLHFGARGADEDSNDYLVLKN